MILFWELVNFMVQVGYEFCGLSWFNESFNFIWGILQILVEVVWCNGNGVFESVCQEVLCGCLENLVELMYGGCMGNDVFGDVLKYYGCGYLFLVGKENYECVGKVLDLDLVNYLELVVQFEYVGCIVVWQWQMWVLEVVCEDVCEVMCVINGGLNGIEVCQQ